MGVMQSRHLSCMMILTGSILYALIIPLGCIVANFNLSSTKSELFAGNLNGRGRSGNAWQEAKECRYRMIGYCT